MGNLIILEIIYLRGALGVFSYKTQGNCIQFICVSNQNTINFIYASLCWFFSTNPYFLSMEDGVFILLSVRNFAEVGTNLRISSHTGLCYLSL